MDMAQKAVRTIGLSATVGEPVGAKTVISAWHDTMKATSHVERTKRLRMVMPAQEICAAFVLVSTPFWLRVANMLDW